MFDSAIDVTSPTFIGGVAFGVGIVVNYATAKIAYRWGHRRGESLGIIRGADIVDSDRDQRDDEL